MADPPKQKPEGGDDQSQGSNTTDKSGGKRHATMMGLAPAPHLGGLSGSAGANARAEADARRKRILARLEGLGSTAAMPVVQNPEPTPSMQPAPAPSDEAARGSTTAILVGNYPHQHGVSQPPPVSRSPYPPVQPNAQPAQVVAAQIVGQDPMPAPSTLAMMRAAQQQADIEQSSTLAMRPAPEPGRLRTGIPGPPPFGMASEKQVDRFRELRTRLLEMGQGLKKQRFTTLVVPLISGSGGSFVCRNLAAAFTMEGRGNSLLVDCNLNRPSQHLAFRSSSDTGLFAFLENPHGDFNRLAQPTTLPGLGLITAGRARYREYFSSQPMRGLMQMVRQTDCFAFLDGPAVHGSPDARILSELADFVILVVGYGKGTPTEIAEAAATFDKNKFAGVVFNEQS